MIPVSVLIVTKNEADHISRCLTALSDFAEIVVIDSGSADSTVDIARGHGARVEDFTWNGRYPKKRQWCLNHLSLKHEWVFFVDADEVVTEDLKNEMAQLFTNGPAHAGYFVKGRYVWNGQVLKHGLVNNKLVLFDRRKIHFPVVDDLDLPGMGEIEGHYQPVLKNSGSTGQLKAPLLHYAYEDQESWQRRHERYAAWEAGMNRKNAWPRDPDPKREFMKQIFRALPLRPAFAFLHCYVLKLGFLDGRAGWDFAKSRFIYYRMISSIRAGARTGAARARAASR